MKEFLASMGLAALYIGISAAPVVALYWWLTVTYG
jgi:hypothetical protein